MTSDNKTTFTDLSTPLKILVVWAWASIAWFCFWFMVGFTLGITGY